MALTLAALWLAGGGHPPPLLVSHAGGVRELMAPGIPIGWPGAGTTEVVTVTLDRSDTVVFYTDGLVEAGKDIEKGLAALGRAAVETARYPAQSMARALIRRALEDSERSDDALALVLRRRTPPAGRGHRLSPFEYRFSPNPASVPLARHLLGDWLSLQQLEADETGDLLLVATELCANAVRVATGAPGSVVLRAWTDEDAVVIEVEDDGPGLDLPEATDEDFPDPYAEEGRGLYLVRALTDEVEVRTEARATVVRCLRRAVLPGPEAPEAG